MRRSVLVTGRYWPFRDLRGGQGASAADDLTGPLAALLVELTEQLTTTAADALLAALRAAGVLDTGRRPRRAGRGRLAGG
ncbi:hypothetical protein ACFYYM_34250 [Streptomyces erythrochromogenes]|uniref:hypothetical protein n=1 Tax=Streptomyces erythrochromogenes TaxID=285574 RepID=UPI0036A69D0E